MVVRARGGDGDAAGDPVGDDRGAFGPDGLRQEVEQTGQPLLRRIAGREDVEGARQQRALLVGDAVRLATELRPAFDELGRRGHGGRGDRQPCLGDGHPSGTDGAL